MLRKAPSPSFQAIALVLLFFVVISWRWSGNSGPPIIRSDAAGYYAYLRAVFINHDLGHEAFDHTYLHETPDGTLNKYFAGEAVLLTPFFLVAHGWAHINGDATDGLSPPYLLAVRFAALVYAFFGLLAFRALLRCMGVGEAAIAATLLTVGFGTQLVQYTSIQPGWSHVYSFCMVAVFLLLTVQLADGMRPAKAMAWGGAFGLVVLLRPVNGLVLLAVPVVLGDGIRAFIGAMFKRWRLAVPAAIACAGVLAIQGALWYAQTGHFIADGYKGEGFHWTRPEVLKVLIGFRRGLFLWTPTLIVAAISVFVLWRNDRWRSLWLMAYWAANTYVIASWWIWYYGSGWGQRVYIDHYVVLFLPLALVLARWRSERHALWLLSIGALGIASLFTMAQFHQYNHRLLDPEGMNAQKYAYAFLRFDDAHRDRLGGMYRVPPYNPNGMDVILEETCGMDQHCAFWSGGYRIPWEGAYSPATVCLYDADREFGIVFGASTDTLPMGRSLYLEVGLQRMEDTPGGSLHGLGVVEVHDARDSIVFYETFRMNPVPGRAGVWEQLEYRIPVPPLHRGDCLNFYLWNKDGRSQFMVDDLFMRVSAVRPY